MFRIYSQLLKYSSSTFKRKMASSHFPLESEANRIIWVDLEMTGLDIEKDHIIEMACLISDGQLNVIAEGPNLVINQPDELLRQMNDWCTEHHGKSGLTQAVRESNISLQQAEKTLLDFIKQHTPEGKCPLAGNSVYTDRLFLQKYMPNFTDHLHHRIIDVSSIKELCRRWYPEVLEKAPAKKNTHRALDDILESLEELKYYKTAVFK